MASLEQLVHKIAQVEVAGDEFWQNLFDSHIVKNEDPQADDLLYFVRKSPPSSPNGDKESEEVLFVKRRKGKVLSLTKEEADDVRWKESFYLNLIVQLHCSLTVAICKKTLTPDGRPTMNALSYVTKRVYASPNKTRMDKKGAEYSCSFPLIYFNVEDFEDTFSNIIIDAEEYFCVELSVLISKDEDVKPKKVIVFQGAVGWDAICETFKKRGAASKENHVEYIMMRGPSGKGHAQVAMSVPPSDVTNPEVLQPGLRRQGLLQGLFRLGQQPPVETPLEQLKCCLTFVNVTWQSIVSDINTFILKK